ncbi:hypothetical protein LY625_07070 [Lysobacter sp. GX 14042]|uniref:hypothetical protein n=1 Tax=Lysobacter sp. GX 14042 TaxID=2907155 RepID=UPI001F46DD03|nr:hypothetical protein [Lysobacter sp. GX 14042]MCE7032384.1 hypothetical protein [Lysobacter sp. GX 14042]
MNTDAPPSLQIHQHLDFQRRFRVVRMVGVGLMVLLLAGALSGLLGDGGPLSRAHVDSGPLRVEHPRFAQRHARVPVQVQLDPAPGGAPLVLVLQGPLVGEVDIDHVTPQPEQVRHSAGSIECHFAEGTAAVALQLEPDGIGRLEATVRAVAADGGRGEAVPLRLFVYP